MLIYSIYVRVRWNISYIPAYTSILGESQGGINMKITVKDFIKESAVMSFQIFILNSPLTAS